MMTLLEGYPDSVLAVEGQGTITAEDYQQVLLPAMSERLSRHPRLRLLYLMGDEFEGFTAGAAWEDSKVGMKHFTHFERVAFVTDTDWMRRAVRGFGCALPGEVRVYETDDLDDASAWIQEAGDPGELEFELDEAAGILTLRPRDELEAGDFDRLAATVDPWLAEHGELKGLLVSTESFPGWDDMAALFGHLGFVKAHHRQVHRVALVTDSRFLGALPRIGNLLVKAEVRQFPFNEEVAARAWLEAPDANA